MKRLIHTPEGVRDIIGIECDKKRYLESRIDRLFRTYGYQSIQTPTFEFFDVFGQEVGTTPSKDLYKFFDREGNTLVLRPDFTPSIARSVAMYFGEETMPLRLSYQGSVFSNNSSYQGRLKEMTHMGAELINDDSVEADAEILSLVVSLMQKAGLEEFQVTVGMVDFFGALAEEAGMDEDTLYELKSLLAVQNLFGAQELIGRLKLRADLEQALLALPELFGNEEMLSRARTLTSNPKALAAISRLERISEILKYYHCEKYVAFDLGMVSDYSYYTGIIFQAYTYGSGDAVIKGGRYDRLLEQFGKKAAAVGFVAETDMLLLAIDRQRLRLPVEDIKTMLLYPATLEACAVRFAAAYRAKNQEMACVRLRESLTLEDYVAYGKRNQFGRIIRFKSETEAEAIDLTTGMSSPVTDL